MFTHLQEKFPMLHDKKKLLLFAAVIFSLFLASPARFIEKKGSIDNDNHEATGLAGANLAIGGSLLIFMMYIMYKGGFRSLNKNHMHVFSFLACVMTVIFSSMMLSNMHNEVSSEDVPLEILWIMAIVNLVAVSYWIIYYGMTHGLYDNNGLSMRMPSAFPGYGY
jgi:hypothetical protein